MSIGYIISIVLSTNDVIQDVTPFIRNGIGKAGWLMPVSDDIGRVTMDGLKHFFAQLKIQPATGGTRQYAYFAKK